MLPRWLPVGVLFMVVGWLVYVVGFFPVREARLGDADAAQQWAAAAAAVRSASLGVGGEAGAADDASAAAAADVCGVWAAGPVPAFDRVAVVLVDALRADFLFGGGGGTGGGTGGGDDAAAKGGSRHGGSRHGGRSGGRGGFPFVHRLLRQGFVAPHVARAQAPTVTLPRLKALLSGTVPTFIDFALNFDSPELLEDNVVRQLALHAKRRLVLYGDDTWLKMFPIEGQYWYRTDGVSSFFVQDTVEVDDNVTRHLDEDLEMKEPAAGTSSPASEPSASSAAADLDWDVLLLHFLGLDHIGHSDGPRSVLMHPKQHEMDRLVQRVWDALRVRDERTGGRSLLLLLSDHGMNAQGNHGGSQPEETDAVAAFITTEADPAAAQRWAGAGHYRDDDGSVGDNDDDGDDDNYGGILGAVPTAAQIDVCPSLASLLGVAVPRNSMGAPLVDALLRGRVVEQVSGGGGDSRDNQLCRAARAAAAAAVVAHELLLKLDASLGPHAEARSELAAAFTAAAVEHTRSGAAAAAAAAAATTADAPAAAADDLVEVAERYAALARRAQDELAGDVLTYKLHWMAAGYAMIWLLASPFVFYAVLGTCFGAFDYSLGGMGGSAGGDDDDNEEEADSWAAIATAGHVLPTAIIWLARRSPSWRNAPSRRARRRAADDVEPHQRVVGAGAARDGARSEGEPGSPRELRRRRGGGISYERSRSGASDGQSSLSPRVSFSERREEAWRTVGSATPVAVVLAVMFHLQFLSPVGSSYVEEEHQTWYFAVASALLACVVCAVRDTEPSRAVRALAGLALLRFIRAMNQTGDKWLNLPDMADWFAVPGHTPLLAMLTLAASSLPFMVAVVSRRRRRVSPAVRVLAAAISVLLALIKSVGLLIPMAQQHRLLLARLIFGAVLALVVDGVAVARKRRGSAEGGLLRFRVAIIGLLLLLHRPPNTVVVSGLWVMCSLARAALPVTARGGAVEHMLLVALGRAGYFALGNSNSLASFDIAGAYTGLADYIAPVVGTFALLIAASGPLLVLLHQLDPGGGDHDDDDDDDDDENLTRARRADATQRFVPWLLLWRGTNMVFILVVITLLRHHLFVWSVFSPKLLLDTAWLLWDAAIVPAILVAASRRQ